MRIYPASIQSFEHPHRAAPKLRVDTERRILLKAALEEERYKVPKYRVTVLAFEAVCKDAGYPCTPTERGMLNMALARKEKEMAYAQ